MDVEDFLSKIPKRILDWWCAYAEEFPLAEHDEQWLRHAVHMMLLNNVVNAQLATAGGKPIDIDMNSFLPLRLKQVQEIQIQDPDKIFQALQSRFGV